MVYKTVSSKTIIAKIQNTFQPNNSDWIERAFIWIGEALGIMRIFSGYDESPECVNVSDYIHKLPCALDALLGIEYQGYRLPRDNGINGKCKALANKAYHPTDWYSLNPNYIHTSFETGEIIVYFLSLPLDEDGFPMIPDDEICLMAVEWYVMAQWLASGNTHPVFSYEDCEKRWLKYYPMAQNRAVAMDLDGIENFKQIWTRTVVRDSKWSEFMSNLTIPSGTSTE